MSRETKQVRNFIIFFEEKEGTSPLVHLLDNFERISVIHQHDEGWEPFDVHNCGTMSLRYLKRSLNIIFNQAPTDFARLNQIYTKTAKEAIKEIETEDQAVGFKMRFKPPRENFPSVTSARYGYKLSRVLARNYMRSFRHMMFDLLKRNDVVVFLAVRQDVMRWALSKYHGEGTGNPGHLQFKLARGEVTRANLGQMHVDCARLRKIIEKCERSHFLKYRLMKQLKRAGISVYPLFYEDFIADKRSYFSGILNHLGLDASDEKINHALEKGAYFKKVHSSDISDFVENHEEVREKFGDRFVPWKHPP